jgi:hypothetical protein
MPKPAVPEAAPAGGIATVPQVVGLPAEPAFTSADAVALPAGDPDRHLSDDAAALVARGLAGETPAAYERHWGPFERWCRLRGRTALAASAETLAEYVHHLTKTTTQYGGAPSPSQFLLQWDDEGVERQPTLDLFDAFGTREKTLHANLGGHAGTPWFEVDDAARFFTRHLK